MMRLTLTYDDVRKVAAIFRKPEAALTGCGPAPGGGVRVTILADLAKLSDIGKIVNSLVVSVTLDMAVEPLGEGRVQLKLLDLTLDKSQAPLLARPFLRPKAFKKVLFRQIANQPGVAVDVTEETVVGDLNDLEKLKDLGLKVVIHELEIGAEDIMLGLTLVDREVQ